MQTELGDERHNAANTSEATDGEESEEPELLPPRHLYFPHQDNRDRQQAIVKCDIDDTKYSIHMSDPNAARRDVLPRQDEKVEVASSWTALKDIEEEGRQGVHGAQGEEDPVDDLPFSGGERRQSYVEAGD